MKQLRTILQSKTFSFLIILFTIIYVILNVKVIKYQSNYDISETNFIGEVIKIKQNDYGYTLTLKAKEKLIVYLDKFNYNLGDTIYVKGVLEEPKNNTVLNDFNYKEYCYQNQIFYLLKAEDVKLLKKNKNIIYTLKTKLLNYLDTFKSKNYLKSFILGDTSFLAKEMYESYQINGICHLLAIGSTHITFLSMIIFYLFKKFDLKENLAYYCLFLIVFFYLLLTSFPVAIFRTYLYLVMSFLNKKLKLFLKPIKLFLLVLTLTLLIHPFYIYHKGFLYSYIVSFILILMKDYLNGSYINKLIKISLLSFLFCIPLNIYFNYSINLLSIIYNLIYVPLFNLLVFPMVIIVITFPILDKLFYHIITLLNNLSLYLNQFTFCILIFKKMSLLILVYYYIMLTYVIKKVLNGKKIVSLILIFTLIIHYFINDLIPNDFFMIIDVNQGDSSLYYSNNKTILVDTGGLRNQEVTKTTINMLKSLGIRKIDYLFLSHGDYDHMGSSFYLVNNFEVKEVIFNQNELNDLEQKLIKLLIQKKIKYCIAKEKKTYTINNLKIYLLNRAYTNENDSSLVMYLLFRNKKILLMGDASKEVEKELISKYNLQEIDYLKVGHHGSKTSTSKEFLAKITPKYAFISVGLNNIYNHPSSTVLELLEKYKVKTFETRFNGSIIVNLKKGTINSLAP